MPAGYRVEYGGQFESQQSASRRLFVLALGVVAGLFMLLVLAFGKARDAILVMVNLPLALIGGVAGVFLAGGVLSVASMIGFITLFGIATRNGIMLVSHIQHLMTQEGVSDFRTAVERGAHERLVPILMTAMAAGSGADSARTWRGKVRQRDSDADGDRDPLWPDDVHTAEHGRRTHTVSAVCQAVGTRMRRRFAGRLVVESLGLTVHAMEDFSHIWHRWAIRYRRPRVAFDILTGVRAWP
jgi:hypothetical protein